MKFALLTVSYSGLFYAGEVLSIEQQIYKVPLFYERQSDEYVVKLYKINGHIVHTHYGAWNFISSYAMQQVFIN